MGDDGSAGQPTYFERFVTLILQAEGAPTDDPDDPGKETVYGIARAFHPTIPWPPTRSQAVAIYHRDYWSAVKGDELPPGLALLAFDAAVVNGAAWARSALQVALGVKDDGIIGPNTIAAARHSTWRTVLAFTSARLGEFERQVRIYPYKTKWASGWRNRCLAMFREAVLLERSA